MSSASTVSSSLDAIREELARTRLSTSTMNFIVVIDDAQRRDWIVERATLLGDKHPSFSLIFDRSAGTGEAVVQSAPAPVASTVEGSTAPPPATAKIPTERYDSHASVQGERVVIDAGDFSADDVEQYVTALCPTGVPTVLWWTGARLEGDWFEALLRHAGTLIVDSSGDSLDETTLRDLCDFHAEHPDIHVHDLAWLRLRPWLETIALLFDEPNAAGELYTIRRLYVRSGSDSEALYLGGWLASRLGWTVAGVDAFADKNGSPVRFMREREGGIRRVHSVCLDTDTSWYHGEIGGDGDIVRTWVEGDHAQDERLVPLQAIDNATLLERAVLEPASDELFDNALQSAATLLGRQR